MLSHHPRFISFQRKFNEVNFYGELISISSKWNINDENKYIGRELLQIMLRKKKFPDISVLAKESKTFTALKKWSLYLSNNMESMQTKSYGHVKMSEELIWIRFCRKMGSDGWWTGDFVFLVSFGKSWGKFINWQYIYQYLGITCNQNLQRDIGFLFNVQKFMNRLTL